jgi:hypothetical protein
LAPVCVSCLSFLAPHQADENAVLYDIKCLLDEILNAVENLTDSILNALKPLLEPLISKYTSTLCLLGLGINILGICL